MRLLVLGAIAAVIMASAQRGGALATGEESPWPRTDSLPANVRAVERVVADLEAKVEDMELSTARYADWEACLRGVPISEYGDPDGRFGYVYDERDGTGPGFRPALAVDRTSRPRREDYLFLALSRRGGCGSAPPVPGGTAEPAAVAAAGSPAATIARLERRVKRLKRAVRHVEAGTERFDEWESCVSWVPVTQHGDPDGAFGYLFGARGAAAAGYRPALVVDRSDWDDPDYQFLAFVGGDRPGRGCQDEPGEAVD